MNGRSLLLLLLPVLAAGCDFPGRPRAADRPVPPDQVLDFATLYRENCAGCHGAAGKLGPAPPLNDAVFLAIVPDRVLLQVIAEGRPGTPMPAFGRVKGGPLTEAQVKVLAEGLKPRWGRPEKAKGSLPSYTVASGDSNRGAAVFKRACAGCHGDDGEGDDAGAINDRAFLALISDQALRRFAITGRPDRGMPDYAGKDDRPDDFQPLNGTELDDLVAHLSRWREGGPNHSQ